MSDGTKSGERDERETRSSRLLTPAYAPAPGSSLPLLRWGIYLVLIAMAVGNMTGRLLAVNSVDQVQLETYSHSRAARRANAPSSRTKGYRETEIAVRLSPLTKRGFANELRLQRPFLSANDRSRWMTIRSLVEHGTYEIDEIVSSSRRGTRSTWCSTRDATASCIFIPASRRCWPRCWPASIG